MSDTEQGLAFPPHHETLIKGFRSVADKNALGWVVLDTKSERFITAAIATAINRRAERRIAHVEFPPSRIDLVVLREPIRCRARRHLDATTCSMTMRYEAKAGQIFDFAATASTKPRYLGAGLNDDMKGMTLGNGAGLFFISEASAPNRHLKYFGGHVARIDEVRTVLCRHVGRGSLVAHEIMDCGVADRTNVKIHMFVFDPK